MSPHRMLMGRRSWIILALSSVILGAGALGIFIRAGGQPAGDRCSQPGLSAAQIAAYRGISVELMEQLRAARSLSPADICVMPQAKLERAIFRTQSPKPDKPDEAIAWRNLALKDESGVIKLDGFQLAREHMAQMQAGDPAPDAPAAGITRGQWRWLGPGNIGGRVRALLIHPTEPNRMWAGSVSGGIWYTSDGGARWDPVADFMGNLAVSTLAMDPTNTSVIYAGTGEGFYNGDGIRGAGIFKSVDGGLSWAQLSATATTDFLYVNRITIAPDGAAILAATRSGLWRSTNGGSSWSLVLVDDVLDVDFNPNSATYAVASGRNGRAWRSTNGGASWAASTGLPTLSDFWGRVEVAYAPSVAAGAGTVYASVNVNGGEIWRSTNGGQSFSLVSTGDSYLGGQGWYDNVIWVAPDNANLLIVGGIDLWRSTDGGATLQRVSTWWNAPGSAHADNHAIVAHPGYNGSTNRTVFFGNDGGIYKAADISALGSDWPQNSAGWQELNNNLGITQFYGAAGNPTTGVIIGGTQDNGTLRYTGDREGWSTPFGGDGGFSAADPTDPAYFYGEYVNARIHRSSNGGNWSDYIYGEIWLNGQTQYKSPPYVISDAVSGHANFIAPFILDPNNPNRMLVGADALWRSNDVKAPTTNTTGPQWAAIKPATGSYISAIAVAQGDPDSIWVGHNDGAVYRTSNGTAASPTWARVDQGAPALPNRYVARIAIDPNIHTIAYVTFGGFSPDNVYRTADGGATWADRTGVGPTGLPDAPVRSLVISPVNANWIYVGTEVGIFASEDAGLSWRLPHDGPANVSVDELFWVGDTLSAATHGRGIYQVAASLRLSSTSLSFGTQPVGSASLTEPVVVVNTSETTIFGVALAISGDFFYTTNCGVSLAAGASCTINIGFNPSAAGGRSGALTITSQAIGGPHTISLAGTGTTSGTPTAPAAPTGLQVAGASSASLSLAWQDNAANELGFRIYKWGFGDVGWEFYPYTTVGANLTTFTDAGLACGGVEYFYLITAYNSAGESARTGWVKGATGTCPAATATATPELPLAPSNFQVSGTTASSVSLTWQDNAANELGFRIYKWGFGDVGWEFYPYTTVGVNAATFTDGGLACGADYFYLMTAYNSTGESGWPAWVKGTTLPCQEPTATATATASPSVTRTATASPSVTRTATASPSVTRTATRTASPSPTVTATRTVSPSVTVTASPSPTATATGGPGLTATPTPTATATATRTATASPSPTPSPTATATQGAGQTPGRIFLPVIQ